MVVLLAALGAIVGLGASSEGSKLKDVLGQDVAKGMTYDDVKKQLTDMGCDLSESTPTELKGMGASHSMLVFSARVAVRVGFDKDGKANSYEVGK